MTQSTNRPPGKYYEELNVGDTWETKSRTVTETDLVNFTSFSWDTHPMHTNAEYARNSPFGQRLMHGPGVFAMASGLEIGLGFKEGTSLVMLGMTWNMKNVVFIGDTIRVREVVASKRETKKPDRGIVTFDLEVLNQKDEIVQHGQWVIMFSRIPAEFA
ncbi:acyl dehydratase [Paraburkholderia sp. BL27I4N3]|uniref:MaoC/PaaZ C-terminal domain-containing protein n=1 Tax=Paraburkholderia sp. BL27I4N3 TaxID=1938805 RepID=UPI000E22548D|nr:MaoC/PaaZ C-terminal domain-containing protein [Paraburkholderia sp. BL27I4N3]REE07483.1 acyl dehydratase [Paraburkholderia sp. BL27I4N3]